MIKKYFLFIILAVFSQFTKAQEDSFSSTFGEALRMEEERFNKRAGEYWLELHYLEPDNANINYRLGLSYLNSNLHKFEALQYLELITKNDLTKNFDYYNSGEKKAPQEAWYYLAHAYHLNNNLDSAIIVYNRLKEIISAKHYMRPDIDHQIEMCNNAKIQFAHPKDYTITNIGPVINTEYAEFGPVISLDESELFFTSNRIRSDSSNWNAVDLNYGNYYDDVYGSYKNLSQNTWGKPELLSFNDVSSQTATINVSPDGQILYLFISNIDKGSGVYQTNLIGETWRDPLKLQSETDIEAWQTHIAISADGNTLFFVSNRSNGVGEKDIYRSVKLPNGEWSKALNLGEVVNSVWDEEAPFIHPDGKTLYFSSKGHNSMGGYDIFYTTMQDDGLWSKPINIGYPINTTDDDIFFVTSANGMHAYYSSDRPGGFGSEDIYLIDLPVNITQGLAVLKGFIVPGQGETLPGDLSIVVTNIESGTEKIYHPRMRDGGYVIILPPCQEYEINYLRGDESFHKESYFVPCESSYQEIHKEIHMNPLVVAGVSPIPSKDQGAGTVADLIPIGTRTDKNIVAKFEIFFDYNVTDCSIQRNDFMTMIMDIKKALEKYDYIEVTIEGSASKVPTKTYGTNDNLSKSRAKDAETRLIEGLKMNDIPLKNVRIVAINSLTQGPDYKGDATENMDVYKKYQYVIIKAYH